MNTFIKQFSIKKKKTGACTGKEWIQGTGGVFHSVSPIDNRPIAKVNQISEKEYDHVVNKAQEAFLYWRKIPAPKRGEIIRQIGLQLRDHKMQLGKLISMEMGKIVSEGQGEVQEMIDIADFAVGLSRQLYGLSMHSERPNHRMFEQWHPLGVVGIITSFNFPMAVWAWNAMVALVCGDTIIWKPSSSTPLCAIAVHSVIESVLKENNIPEGVVNLIIGRGESTGERLANDKRISLISATGSCAMGKKVAESVGKRLGKIILELGGNNATIIMEDADLELAISSVLFGAIGTAGQRCTTTRRLLVQQGIFETVIERLVQAYRQIKIGNPLKKDTLMGPLVNRKATDDFVAACETIKKDGASIIYGGHVLSGNRYQSGCYVEPTLVTTSHPIPIVQKETFVPILYIIPFETLEEAIAIQNSVDQGLSSSIFTTSLVSGESFLSYKGSDCGIANINTTTSGSEIGGAFGGEKETGGGREAGSDAWKFYMRRQTNTINWSDRLPFAQGIEFRTKEKV